MGLAYVFSRCVKPVAASLVFAFGLASCASTGPVPQTLTDEQSNALTAQIAKDKKFVLENGTLPPDLMTADCDNLDRLSKERGNAGGAIAGGAGGAAVGFAFGNRVLPLIGGALGATGGWLLQQMLSQNKANELGNRCSRKAAVVAEFGGGRFRGTPSTLSSGGIFTPSR